MSQDQSEINDVVEHNKELLRKAMKQISVACNSMAEDDIVEVMTEAITNDHRTLQQVFWRTMFATAKNYSEQPEYCFDPRNEGSGEACRQVTEVLKNVYMPFV